MKINKTIRRIFDGTKIFFELKKFEENIKKIETALFFNFRSNL